MKEKIEKKIVEIKKDIQKYPNFYLFGMVSLIFLMVYLFSFIQPKVYSKSIIDRFFVTLRFLFVNEHNRLNWVGLSAIGVLISYVATAKFNRDKLRADLVSQSRMKWLDKVRDEVTEWIGNIIMYGIRMEAYLNLNKMLDDRKNELEEIQFKYDSLHKNKKIEIQTQLDNALHNYTHIKTEVIKKQLEINKIGEDLVHNIFLIKLYFSESDEHKEILGKIRSVQNNYSEYIEFMAAHHEDYMNIIDELQEKRKNNFDKINEDLNDLSSELNLYFKNEWEKVKQGK